MIARMSDRISKASPFASSRARLLHEASPEGVGQRGEHRDLDHVLQRGEDASAESGVGEWLEVADDDQLDLAHQERHEADEDDGMHHAGLPVAPDHPGLQESVRQHALRACQRPVPAHFGRSATTIASLRQASQANATNATSMSSDIPSGLIVGGRSGRGAFPNRQGEQQSRIIQFVLWAPEGNRRANDKGQ